MIDFAEWAWLKLSIAFTYEWFAAATIGLFLGMGLVEFVARMLPAKMEPVIATRVTWAIACGVSAAVAYAINPSGLGFGIALTVGVGAPSTQLFIMRAIYARYPAWKPQAMAENLRACPPPGEVRWPPQ